MSMIKKVFFASAVLFCGSINANAAPSATVAADAQGVNAACQAEASTAGCGNEVVGKGLLKCMTAYKQAHKEFKYSDGCKGAMKQLHQDKAAGK